MTTSQRTAPTVTLWLLAVAVAGSGCTTVTSRHPLSDDKTSVIDKRLLGNWRFVDTENKTDPQFSSFVVGRVKDTENMLELVFADLVADDLVEVNRLRLFPTSINGKHYVSVRKPHGDGVEYVICQYKLAKSDGGQYKLTENDRGYDDDELHLFLMTTKMIVGAIEGDKLTGSVRRLKKPLKRTAGNPFNAEYQYVRITATSEQLIAYIRKHEKNIFDTTRPIVLKRCTPIWR